MTQTLDPVLSDDLIERAHRLLDLSCEKELYLTAAESCTGGLLAALLTDVEGCSHVFERGFVSYSVQAKCDLLGIARERIDNCGAVSREVAIAMAKGALERSEADIALSVTGFAGPGGEGDEEGLVHFACLRKGRAAKHREEHFGSVGRDGVRRAALAVALEMMEDAGRE